MELDELLQSVDIAEYIGQYVDLEEKGGELWGISPFTDPPENTPSFSVRKETGSWYDFSSGKGGNAYTFAKLYNKCSRSEAIALLESFAGINGTPGTTGKRLAVTNACKRFAKPKSRLKPNKTSAMPDTVMEQYEKKREKLQVWEDEGISQASMERFQVRYDGFLNAIVYPVRDPDGKIVNIGCRTLDPDYKSKGKPKYFYLKPWGSLRAIYGLSENMESIKKQREIILFEGCKSVLKADTWGITNCGAILTSHLSPEQFKILIQLGLRVVFALDKEIDIRKDHNIQKLKRYVPVEYLYDRENLLSEKDAPVDEGLEVFQKLYEGRKRYR